MKILTKEEESAHNRVTWEAGLAGAAGGVALGTVGVLVGGRRYQAFRQLSLPFRAYIVTAAASFGGVIAADRASRAFEKSRHADSDYVNESEKALKELTSNKTTWEKAKILVSEQRYPIVFGSWVASMVAAFSIVGRNKYITGQQKLVQARVYAQGLTLAVLIASFALESNDLRAGKGRWETVKVLDPDDPEHKRIIEKRIHHEAYQGEDQWMDMLEAQERRMRERGRSVRGRSSSTKNEKE